MIAIAPINLTNESRMISGAAGVTDIFMTSIVFVDDHFDDVLHGVVSSVVVLAFSLSCRSADLPIFR